jgi:hypothetical protein
MRLLHFVLAFATAMVLMDGLSVAAIIVEVEPNNAIATAQDIDAHFSLDFSPDIGDIASNTSTQIPHVTIDAQPNDDSTVDFFSFTVTTAGSRGIFDIDQADILEDEPDFDSWIELYSGDGMLLASNDDAGDESWGQGGSNTILDSYLEYLFTLPGTYMIAVGQATDLGTIPSDADYVLHVSVGAAQAVVPEPTAILVWAILSSVVVVCAVQRRRARRRSG